MTPRDGGPRSSAEFTGRLRKGERIVFSRDNGETDDVFEARRSISATWIEEFAREVNRVINVPVWIENAAFVDRLSLSHVTFQKEVVIRGCYFGDTVDLGRSTFQHGIDLQNSHFYDGFRLDDAQVEGLLWLNGAHLYGDLDPPTISFEYAAARCVISCNGTKFFGSVSFHGAAIDRDARFVGAEFAQNAQFTDMRVAGDLLFSQAVAADKPPLSAAFGGRATFSGTQIKGEIVCEGVDFRHFVFQNVQVGRDAFFSQSTFNEVAAFEACELTGSIFFGEVPSPLDGEPPLAGAKFRKAMSFDGTHVKGQALFNGTEFGDTANFNHVTFDTGAVFGRAESRDVSSRATFAKDASFAMATFGSATAFRGVQFGGGADFTGAQAPRIDFSNAEFTGLARFRDAKFTSITFGTKEAGGADGSVPATFAGKVDLRGLTYDRFAGDWKAITRELSPHDRQPFVQLSNVLRAAGADDDANRVHIRRLWRDRRSRGWKKRRAWPGHIAHGLYAFLGYGVVGWAPPAIALGVILLGAALFAREDAVAPRQEPARRDEIVVQNGQLFITQASQTTASDQPYCTFRQQPSNSPPQRTCNLPFWPALGVSVNQFVPIVEVTVGRDWKPQGKQIGGRWFPVTYTAAAVTEKVLGSLLLPLSIAIATGVLRRAPAPPGK